MNTLSDDIQDIIYKYKHQLEFKDVLNDILMIRFNKLNTDPQMMYCGMCDDVHHRNYDCICEEYFSDYTDDDDGYNDYDGYGDDGYDDLGLGVPPWMYYL